ncbi:MAG: DUF1800 domain-containing protein [Candidatus Eremiobacteraeota bacterium]|nr:DUF1800 domain-containing protein [Candidatus Eremiobacteraeota bacterium]MCW5867621.1 DUF1800 domain-containing protein [Candidatus Eremiobacteraeota bacterium]
MRIWLLLWILTSCSWGRPLSFPYREAGLTSEEAAAHLLNRLSYGPRPGQLQQVVQTGLENWFENQLKAPPEEFPLLSSDPRPLAQAKLRRALDSPWQVREVMTDFWFNHFNVSTTDDDCRKYVAAYEREAIAANALAPFLDILKATAHHPAMLFYLDNAYSSWEDDYAAPDNSYDPLHYGNRKPANYRPKTNPNKLGLNENYARELLELHTLGVDGGYRQQDVTELARILTGWGVEKDAFFFRAERHDPNPKKLLFQIIQPAGRNEGEKALETLALHASTARFLSRKLAVRFVSDQPPAQLLTRLQRKFLSSRGDTRQLLETLLESPEFWNRETLGAKVKSPFELEASSLRILGAELAADHEVSDLLAGMGQEVYACRPPTGWPDKAETWLTPGTLVQRLSFAHRLAGGNFRGVKLDPGKIHPSQPLKTAPAALQAYAEKLLPGRAVGPTVNLLKDAASDPNYRQVVIDTSRRGQKSIPRPNPKANFEFTRAAEVNIVGLLLGCPEFQRR